MVLSTSFPHTSQPGAGRRANSSTLGTSPIRASMRRRASSGFRLCSWTWEMMTWWTFRARRLGRPLVARRHSSALALVQWPGPQNTVLDFRLSFTQTVALQTERKFFANKAQK